LNNDLIICGGDSFVAGDELSGDMLMPGYTSNVYVDTNFNLNQRRAIVDEFKNHQTNARKLNTYNAYVDDCKLRAWPNKLKTHISADVINCSAGGISNEEICHRVIETFHNIDSEQYNNVTVIIMPTDTFRFGFPHYASGYGGEFKYTSYTISHGLDSEGIKPKSMQSVYDLFLTRTDWDNLWKSYCYLIGCKNYLELLGATVIFAESGLWGKSIAKFEGNSISRVEHITNLIQTEIALPSERINPTLPGHHYVESLHDDFAKRLADYLKEKLAK
jgi:hypothetical protein